jgi:DNA ligase (NAD+)
MGQKTLTNLFNSIDNSKKQNFESLIFALGIRHVGESTSKSLVEKYGNIEMLMDADKKDLKDINDIGSEASKSILKFFSDEQNRMILSRLKNAGLKLEFKNSEGEKPLKGKKFIFTGSLSSFTRHSAQAIVVQLGGKTVASVSKNLDYLVVGKHPGSKIDKAKEIGVTILNETEFKTLVTG